jgi:hypothetical protein
MTSDRPLPGVKGAVVRQVSFVPDRLEGAVSVGRGSTARPGALLFDIPGLGRLIAKDGAVVEYLPEAGVDRAAIDSFDKGSLAAAIIHQRGDFPLHAATLVAAGAATATAIVGPSGAGKSTLAYELIRQGWRLLSDDLTRLTLPSLRATPKET